MRDKVTRMQNIKQAHILNFGQFFIDSLARTDYKNK